MPGPQNTRKELLLSLLLAAAAIALYLPMLGADFVFDSRFFVLGNDYVHHLSHLADIATLHVMRLDVMDNNRPFYLATVMINWALCGANPAGHHLVNILLHALVVVLLFRLCRILGASAWIAFGAALIFAVHPFNTEAVAGVTYRYDLLVAAFILGALHFAAAFKPAATRRNILLGAACVACLFLAVGAKENGVAGPFVLAAYWLLFRRADAKPGWLVVAIASFAVVGAFVFARFTLPPQDSLVFPVKPEYPGGSFASAMLDQPRIWTFYLRQIFLPMDLCGFYSDYSIRNFSAAAGFISVAVLVAVQIFFGIRNRLFAFGALFFWLALLPVSNVFPMYVTIADRFLYLPMAGVALMIASIPLESAAARRIGAAALAVAVLALSFTAFRREKVWHDSPAFWNDTVAKNPGAPGAWYGLGITLFHTGRYAESLAAYDRSIRLSGGGWPLPIAGMALSLDALGRRAEAFQASQNAAALDPMYASPDLLYRAFILEKPDSEKLEIIKQRGPAAKSPE